MTGPEHYREAERLLATAYDDTVTTCEGHNPEAGRAIAQAQAHATLALTAATAMQAAVDGSEPGMGSAEFYLRQILAEDTYLRYQQAIGGRAVAEAAAHAEGGGPYPSRLLCSRHEGFGPCPGAPWCAPRSAEDGGQGEPTRAPEAEPGFFQPGRVYTRSHHGETVEFRVTSVDTAPDGSYQAAFGWRIDPEEGWVPGDADDLDGWTEVRDGDEQAPEPDHEHRYHHFGPHAGSRCVECNAPEPCDCLPPLPPHHKLPCGHCDMDWCETCRACAGTGCHCRCEAGEPRADT